MDPRSRLIDVATAIADGAPINWPAIAAHSAAEQPVVGGLQLVERVAAVYAGLAPVASFSILGSDTLAAESQSAASGAPRVWGPLTIVEKIGSGTFSEVYKARDPRLDRPVALKLLRHRTQAGATDTSDVIDEARLLAKVGHPNVVTVHGADRIDGRIGIWMEFVDGRTLEQELRERGSFPADELVRVGIALCDALTAVHAAGLLHRDVKAQNVMRDREGRVRLADFGTGREASDTRLGELAGTPLYLAPEVLAGGPASPASDVYSAGVLLYHLATGSFPVAGRSHRDLREAHARGARVPVRSGRTGLPAAVARVIDRATSLNPARRYQSARAMAAALVVASKARTRNRALLVAGIGVVVLSLGAAAFLWHLHLVPPFKAREWVLVPTFQSGNSNPQFNEGLAYALDWELSNSTYVNVVPPERIADALRLMKRPAATTVDATTAWSVMERDPGISRTVQGSIQPEGQGFVLGVSVAGRDGVVIASFRQAASAPPEFPATVRHLADWVRRYLGEPAASIQEDEERHQHSTVSLRAITAYSEGAAKVRTQIGPDAVDRLRSAIAEAPDFAAAHVMLAWALKNHNRPPSDYLPPLQRAVELSSGASTRERAFIVESNDFLNGETDRALSDAEALVRLYPDDAWRIDDLRFLYQRASRRDDEADALRRVADLRPNDPFASIDAASGMIFSRSLAAALPYLSRARELLQEIGPTRSDDTPPNDSLLQGASAWPRVSWLMLFPVHRLWLERRPTEAIAALAAAEANPEIAGEGSARHYLLGTLHLAFGQLQAAEREFARDDPSGSRRLGRAEVALARGDAQGVATSLQSYSGSDAAMVAVLMDSGNLADAKAFAARIWPAMEERNRQWVASELDAARASGLSENTRHGLEAAVRFFAPIGSARAFLDSETLAAALERSGDTTGAIRTLEATTPLRERIYAGASHSGYFWMRCQAQLAALYREVGQLAKARAIERDLIATLGAADADDAMLLELKKRMP